MKLTEIINGPGFDSASNRNEYEAYFLGGKGGRCVRLTTCAVVTKSGNLNFLEPSGPLRVYYGTALPLPETINIFIPVYADSIHAFAAFIYGQEQRQKRALFHINPLSTLLTSAK